MAAQHVPRDLVRPSSGFQQLAQKKTKKQDVELNKAVCERTRKLGIFNSTSN